MVAAESEAGGSSDEPPVPVLGGTSQSDGKCQCGFYLIGSNVCLNKACDRHKGDDYLRRNTLIDGAASKQTKALAEKPAAHTLAVAKKPAGAAQTLAVAKKPAGAAHTLAVAKKPAGAGGQGQPRGSSAPHKFSPTYSHGVDGGEAEKKHGNNFRK